MPGDSPRNTLPKGFRCEQGDNNPNVTCQTHASRPSVDKVDDPLSKFQNLNRCAHPNHQPRNFFNVMATPSPKCRTRYPGGEGFRAGENMNLQILA